MPIITKESANQHCRTCLTKLSDVVLEGSATKCHAPPGDEDDTKSISINLSTNENLLHLIENYVGKDIMNKVEYPQNVCLSCFHKLQEFDKFRKQALESVATLKSLFFECDVAKDELEDERENGNEKIYSMMLKDALMETETVVLNDLPDISALVNVKLQVPDPFSAKAISKRALNKNKKTRKKISAEKINKADENNVTTDVNEYTDEFTSTSFKLSSTDEEDDDDDPLSKMQKLNIFAERRKRHGCNGRTKNELAQPKKNKLRDKPRKEVPKKSHRCDQCNHYFAHKLTLDAHIRKVHEDEKRPYQCDRCDKTYTSFYALNTHISVIHEANVYSYACEFPDCHRSYKSLYVLQRHSRDKHLGLFKRKTYVCELCGTTFNQIANLKHHLRCKHQTEAEETLKKKHICNICNKQFISLYTLKYHMLQLHSSDMKFECDICGKRVAKKFMLVQHMRVHALDCFPCNQCDKKFKHNNQLNRHVRAVHLKLKPYSCQYCPQTFAKRCNLQHHEYIHTGEKPYVCDICGQGYRQQNTLKSHRKSHERMIKETWLAKSIKHTSDTYLEGQMEQQQLHRK